MAQYRKLFDSSEIEYITPFLKLWMSFNNCYKQDLKDVKIKTTNKNGNIKTDSEGNEIEKNISTDREAINEYKKQGPIKNEFIRLLNGRSNIDENFQDALANFVKSIEESILVELEYPKDLFIKNPSTRVIVNDSLVFISSNNKENYFSSGDEYRLYENTLELIYMIRCKLVHGDFEIDDPIFIDLIENSYRILYPIMEKILQKMEE